MHKRLLACFAAGLLTVSLAACGQNTAAPPTETQIAETLPAETQASSAKGAEGDIASPQAQTQPKTLPTQPDETQAAVETTTQKASGQFGPLFQKHVRDKVADGTYTLRTEQTGMKIIASVDGEDSAIETDAAGLLHFSLVHKDGRYFMIMHTTKKYAQMTEEEYKKQVSSVDAATVTLDGMRFQESGSQTVGGKTYSTETYDEGDEGVITYFFDDAGVRRTSIVKDGKKTDAEVFTVSAVADASMFEIPTDYTLVSDPSQLLA